MDVIITIGSGIDTWLNRPIPRSAITNAKPTAAAGNSSRSNRVSSRAIAIFADQRTSRSQRRDRRGHNAITPLDLSWHQHPPCFLGVGEIDFLYASSARYAGELQDRGISLTNKIYPGAPHGFLNQRHARTPILKQDVLAFLAANP